jgi:DNA-binding CsgD family transcriptional regulator
VRAGRTAKAVRLLAVIEERARASERVWALAAAARCRGLLAAEFDAPFRAALGWHERVDVPYERARTQLCYGERLRRAHRRVDAREQLRAALETFDALGSRSWAQRAHAELTASGEHARRRDPFAEEQLTPQELQLALIVAEGATNKEAAARLFISPKTVEAHLGSIYRKLGLRSRTELASRLVGDRVA